MRAVVVGGSGQIGGWLLRTLADRGHEAVGTYQSVPYPGLIRFAAGELPAAGAALTESRPDVVFYPAGFTWVDGCERDPARAFAANRDEPLAAARLAADAGARFLFFSTDYVFDGAAGPYAEDGPTRPLNLYGRAKLEAEEALADALGAAQLTIRTSWVYGPERQGKNFAYQLAKALRAGRSLTCPSDQVSSPSYGPDVALAAVMLAERGTSGLIHVAGPEVMDRVRFARALAEGFGLDPALILAGTTAELPQATPRPPDGGLRTPRLDALAPGLMRPMSRALDDFRKRLGAGEGWADPLA